MFISVTNILEEIVSGFLGTVLGSVMFLLYIHGLIEWLVSSQMAVGLYPISNIDTLLSYERI